MPFAEPTSIHFQHTATSLRFRWRPSRFPRRHPPRQIGCPGVLTSSGLPGMILALDKALAANPTAAATQVARFM